MIDPEIESTIRARMSSSRFARWMGIQIVALDDGESRLRLDVEPHHLNPGGIAHGGVVASILDAAIGLAQRTRLKSGVSHVTVQLHVNYLRPVRRGTVEARGRAVRSGERASYGEADLLDEAGRLLARADATMVVVDGTPPSDG